MILYSSSKMISNMEAIGQLGSQAANPTCSSSTKSSYQSSSLLVKQQWIGGDKMELSSVKRFHYFQPIWRSEDELYKVAGEGIVLLCPKSSKPSVLVHIHAIIATSAMMEGVKVAQQTPSQWECERMSWAICGRIQFNWRKVCAWMGKVLLRRVICIANLISDLILSARTQTSHAMEKVPKSLESDSDTIMFSCLYKF